MLRFEGRNLTDHQVFVMKVDAKAVVDGDGMTVYVSATDPRESSSVPRKVQIAAVKRAQARARKDYAKADALQQKMVESGYRLVIRCVHLLRHLSRLGSAVFYPNLKLIFLKYS